MGLEMKKKMMEEARKKQIEELKKKKEAEEARRMEQQAALAIRRVVQKFRFATPDNFDQYKQELETARAEQGHFVVQQKQQIEDEISKTLEAATKRVEAALEI